MRSVQIFLIKLLGAALSVAMGALVSNIYGVETFGNFSVLLVVINAFSLLSSWGLGVNYMREFHSGSKLGRDSGVLLLNLAFCLVLFPLSLFCAWYFVGGTLWIAAPVFVVSSFMATKASMLATRGAQIQNSWLDDIGRIVFPLGAILTFNSIDYLWKFDFFHHDFAIIYLLANGAFAVVVFFYTSKFVNLRFEMVDVESYIKSNYIVILKNGGVVTLSMLLVLLVAQSDRLIVSKFVDSKSLGIYAIAQSAINILAYAVQSVVLMLTPRMVMALHANDLDMVRSISKRYSFPLFVFGLGVTFLSFFLGRSFFSLYGVVSDQGEMALLVLLIGQTIAQFFGFGITVATYSSHKSALILSQLSGLLVGFVLCIWFTTSFGIVGAAFASAISTVLVKMILWVYFKRLNIVVGVM